jgi:hypothetical protein
LSDIAFRHLVLARCLTVPQAGRFNGYRPNYEPRLPAITQPSWEKARRRAMEIEDELWKTENTWGRDLPTRLCGINLWLLNDTARPFFS